MPGQASILGDLELYQAHLELSQTVSLFVEYFALCSPTDLSLPNPSHPSDCIVITTASKELSCPKPHSKLGRFNSPYNRLSKLFVPPFCSTKKHQITKLVVCSESATSRQEGMSENCIFRNYDFISTCEESRI